MMNDIDRSFLHHERDLKLGCIGDNADYHLRVLCPHGSVVIVNFESKTYQPYRKATK